MQEPSLKDIQAAYFDRLEQVFGGPYSQMKKHNVDCADIASDLASRDRTVNAFEAESEGFFETLVEFWGRYREVVHRKLIEMPSLKAVYGGDLSPSYSHNIATSAGLYMDTIVIPDPVLRIADFRPHLNPSDLLYFTAKHALNALTYRDLALADVDPPIVVITSDYLGADVSRVQQLKHLAEIDLRAHFERVFARSFADGSELASFLGQFASIEQLAAMVSDSKRVLFDLDWPDNVAEQIQRHLESTGSRFTVEARSWLQDRPPGPLVSDHLRGRLMQTNDIVLSSQGLSGTPLVDAPTSWQYLVWKYEYDVARTAVEPDSAAHLLITRALQSTTEDDRLRVLRVTPKVLVELRRDGVLEELRQILRAGMEDISFAAAADLEGVTNEIAANVNSAMLEHQTRIDGLVRSGIRWYGLELAPMVVSASMSIIGAATGNVPLTTIGAVGSALGVPTMKDVYRHGKRVLADYRHLRRSASGILFRNV